MHLSALISKVNNTTVCVSNTFASVAFVRPKREPLRWRGAWFLPPVITEDIAMGVSGLHTSGMLKEQIRTYKSLILCVLLRVLVGNTRSGSGLLSRSWILWSLLGPLHLRAFCSSAKSGRPRATNWFHKTRLQNSLQLSLIWERKSHSAVEFELFFSGFRGFTAINESCDFFFLIYVLIWGSLAFKREKSWELNAVACSTSELFPMSYSVNLVFVSF